MDRCESEIDILKNELDADVWTFRFLWLVNLAAVIYGLSVRHYDVAVIAGISTLVSLIGVGRTRRGRRLIDRVARVCMGRK